MNKPFEGCENPPRNSRAFPFWAWNDKLEPKELVRQIHRLKAQGFGGFFMHSREGLETPYLSEEWNECIRICTETAQQLDLQAWLYDEDRWPSGSCGGLVTATDDGRHALKGLTLSVVDVAPENLAKDGSVRALYAAKVRADDLFSLRRMALDADVMLQDGEKLLVIRFEQSKGSIWFNGSAPPDNLSFDTVRAFLDSTHEQYASLLQPYLGSVVPGIFTDEPSLADRHATFDPKRSWIPWSEGMELSYSELGFGDIYETLPLLYFNAEGSFKARHDYWRCIALRYEACFSAQIGQWCDDHDLIFTGHFLQEDKLGLGCRVSGSIMPHYTHQQMPGIDLLAERQEEYLTIKQVSSVAHQYGKDRVLCETYAGCGWDFSFEGQKWIGDWQMALGVTNRCHHMMLYSLKANRKRDYPQSFNYHTSWYEKQYILEDYHARLSHVLQQGEVLRPVLLIHPMSTVWGTMGCSPYGNPIRRNERDIKVGDTIGYTLNRLLKKLEGKAIHSDLGDETLLQRDGFVQEHMLCLKQAAYKVVVLPRLKTLYRTTFRLLQNLVQQGGKVVVLADAPTMIEGQENDELYSFLQSENILHANDDEHLVELLLGLDVPFVELGPGKGHILTQVRKVGNLYYLFVVNTDRMEKSSFIMTVHALGAVSEMDLLTARQSTVGVVQCGPGSLSIAVNLSAAGSALYAIDVTQPVNLSSPSSIAPSEPRYTEALAFPCPISLSMENALTLDRCRYHLGEDGWSGELHTWEVQREVRQALSMSRLDTDEVEQRYKWMHIPHPNDGRLLALEYRFHVEEVATSYALAMEEPQRYEIWLNGEMVPSEVVGYYLDHSFSKVLLPSPKSGENILTFKTRYTNAMSLEDVYLIGSFSVDAKRRLGTRVSTLSLGSWTDQGLFHYPGSVTYQQSFKLEATYKKVMLKGWKFKGACMAITCNGMLFDIPWPSIEEVDITQGVKAGHNNVSFTIYGSPRNLLGPLHLKQKPEWTNPAAFFPTEEERSDAYHVVASGLVAGPTLVAY